MAMIDVFCLNGEIGNITVGDDVVKVVLEFPNNERTWDELAYLFPVKKKLITSRIFAAVNREYQPGRRRTDQDELGTPTLPGVDMREECHGCGRMVDTVNEPFYAKKGENGGKEIILCEPCYRVPQPPTIQAPPAAEETAEPTATCGVCLNFKPPEGEAAEGACAIHQGDPMGAYKKPGEIACDKFALKVSSPDLPPQEAPPVPEGTEDPGCAEDGCGHPNTAHDSDGVCLEPGCSCIEFTKPSKPEGGDAA
jgi:hypothetical protein